MRPLATILIVLWGAGIVEAQTAESTRTRLLVSPDDGSITWLIDKPTGRDFVAGVQPASLYELAFAEPELRLSSQDADQIRIAYLDGVTIVHAETHRGLPVSVTCRFRPEADPSVIAGSIAARSAEPRKLISVRFPSISVKLPIGGSAEDDAVLLPYCDGCIISDPLANGAHREMPYPGAASMQMLAAYDPRAGVYLACRDGSGCAKQLAVRTREDTLQLSAVHLAEATPRTEWALPYDVAITTFSGVHGPDSTTWESAADIYRDWAVRQPWCRMTLADRVRSGDVPNWLVEPSLFYAYALRAERGGETVNRLDGVPAQADAWQGVLGAPVTFMLMSWEKDGPWVAPHYFPPFGGEAEFRQTTDALHAGGHRALVFLSGLNWTLRKDCDGPQFDDTAAFDTAGRAQAICDAAGDVVVSGNPHEGVGEFARICAGTPLGRQILLQSALECQRLGIDCVQADQIVGGGLPLCCGRDHGHPPGGGSWCAERLYRIFDETRREGKRHNHEFAFAIEEPAEFFIPVLDTYHARDYMQGRWPRYGQGAVGVPLFTYVYHEYLHGYGGDSCGVTDGESQVALYQQAMNLVCGKAPGVAVWTRWYEPLSTHRDQIRLLRSHCELWRGPASEFLVYGQMIAEPRLEVPDIALTFRDWSTGKDTAMTVPSVLSSSWRLPDGRTGRVFVCVASGPVEFETPAGLVRIEPGEAVFREKR